MDFYCKRIGKSVSNTKDKMVYGTSELDAGAQVLGHIVGLMLSSPAHKNIPLSQLEWLVFPALTLRQFRLFRKNKRPVGYVSWAFLSDEVGERLLREGPRLSKEEWKSGEQMWMVDLVAPFGGADEIVDVLKNKMFVGKKIKTLKVAMDGTSLDMVDL